MRRCPVCEKDSWCQIGTGEFEGVVLCKRAKSDREKTNKDGVTYWVHRLNALAVRGFVERAPVQTGVVRASESRRHEVYTELLSKLPLSDEHLRDLLDRGLSAEAIRTNGYASLPVQRIWLAQLMAKRFDVSGVPGFVLKEAKKGGRYWTLAAPPGLLVPVRNRAKQIVSLKVRRDGHEEPRYVAMSSASSGGAKADNALHWPLLANTIWDGCPENIIITEGELKADVVAHLKGWRMVSMPGVGCWAKVVEALRAIPSDQRKSVYVALDADWRLNPDVSRAMHQLCAALLAEDHQVSVMQWPLERGKGIDDAMWLAEREQRERTKQEQAKSEGKRK
jgi:hypothetical protein